MIDSTHKWCASILWADNTLSRPSLLAPPLVLWQVFLFRTSGVAGADKTKLQQQILATIFSNGELQDKHAVIVPRLYIWAFLSPSKPPAEYSLCPVIAVNAPGHPVACGLVSCCVAWQSHVTHAPDAGVGGACIAQHPVTHHHLVSALLLHRACHRSSALL